MCQVIRFYPFAGRLCQEDQFKSTSISGQEHSDSMFEFQNHQVSTGVQGVRWEGVNMRATPSYHAYAFRTPERRSPFSQGFSGICKREFRTTPVQN